MTSSQAAFTFSLTFQSGQSERTRLVIVMASSCPVTYVSMNMSLRVSVDESETPAFLDWPPNSRELFCMQQGARGRAQSE